MIYLTDELEKAEHTTKCTESARKRKELMMYATNQIPFIDLAQSKTGCCALIKPDEWDGKTIEFKDKLFAVARTRSLFHIPLNMGSVMKKAQEKINEVGAAEHEWIILSEEESPWHASHYFAVTKDVSGLKMEKMSGTYLTKVFEGPFKNAAKWYEELVGYAESLGKKALNTYFFYTTCPKCAKTYGKNYVVGFEKVS